MANDSKTWRCGKYELSFDRPRIMRPQRDARFV